MFWISSAANWCVKRSKREAEEREIYDNHALVHIRTNGALMNNQDFARDWNCQPKTPMNPVEKCVIWN